MAEHEQDISLYDLFVPLTVRKISVFIILIGLFVFFNALFNGFVWDDKTFIQYNPDVTHLDIMYLLRANLFNNVNAGQYRFLVALYFTILHSLFGDTTFFYHLIQLSIHIGNTILVFQLFRKWIKKELAFFLALLFLIHPIQVESVSFIASSGNPLFVLFGLLALRVGDQMHLSWKRFITISLLLLCSLLAKETGILFVFLFVLQRILFAKKQKLESGVYSILVIGVYSFARFVIAGVYSSKISLTPIARLSLPERILNMPAVFLYYLKTCIAPVHLAIEQMWFTTQVDFLHVYLPLLIDLVFITFLVLIGNRIRLAHKKLFPVYLFFMLWFGMGMGMYSQILPLDMTVADRWFYFPFIGLLGLLGISVEVWLPGTKRWKTIWYALAISFICLLSLRTMVRNSNWSDPVTLYSHDAGVADNFDLENNLGGELNLVQQPKLAFEHYQKSVALFPHETNLFNLGLSYEQMGSMSAAEKYYTLAYASQSYGEVPLPHLHHAQTYLRLSVVSLPRDPHKALKVITEGVRDYPDQPALWYQKALSEYAMHHEGQALAAAKKAVDLVPQNPIAKTLYDRLVSHQPIDITGK